MREFSKSCRSQSCELHYSPLFSTFLELLTNTPAANEFSDTMKKNLIAFEIILLFILSYYSWYLATDYQTPHGRFDMPFLIQIIDMIDLFIHEGGHGVFRLFGQVIYAMGGSLMQFILPFATILVLLRTSGLRSLMGTLYWFGHNMINVSIYIADAPKPQLTLISKHAFHDWHWLGLRLGIMDSTGDIAAVVAFLGTLSLLGAVGMTVYFIIRDIREEFWPAPPPKPLPPGIHPRTRTFLPPDEKRPRGDDTDSIV